MRVRLDLESQQRASLPLGVGPARVWDGGAYERWLLPGRWARGLSTYCSAVGVARSYDEFRSMHMARHRNSATSRLSTLGDALWIASVPAGLVARSFRVFLGVNAAGSMSAVVAHFFQSGTVKDEVSSILRHPIWAVQAETARVAGRT